MGSDRRRKAIENGEPVENAAATRRRRRQEAAIAREELALTLYARGATRDEISDALEAEFGVRLRNSLMELIRRGLYRRIQGNKETVELARETLLAQYRELLEVYMPRALGSGPADADGNRPTPDVRAAEISLKILDKVGITQGVIAPPRSGDINLAIINGAAPADADAQRTRALEQLDRDREKLRQIEGQLSDTPAIEGAFQEVQDGKVMLPLDLLPTEPIEPIEPPED